MVSSIHSFSVLPNKQIKFYSRFVDVCHSSTIFNVKLQGSTGLTCQTGFIFSSVSSSSGHGGKATISVSTEEIPSSLSAVTVKLGQT